MGNRHIDARTQHHPELAEKLISVAINNLGSRAEVARRCGCSAEYLRMLLKGERTMSYGLQILLEELGPATVA